MDMQLPDPGHILIDGLMAAADALKTISVDQHTKEGRTYTAAMWLKHLEEQGLTLIPDPRKDEEQGEPCMRRWDGNGDLIGEECFFHKGKVSRADLVEELTREMKQWKGQKLVRDRAIQYTQRWGDKK